MYRTIVRIAVQVGFSYMRINQNQTLRDLLARWCEPPVRFDPQPVHVVVVATERGGEGADDASAS